MPFTIPNSPSAGFADQAEPDAVDFSILGAGFSRSGVVSGCAVTAQGSPDMTVAVAAGLVIVSGVIATVAAGNVTIGVADGSNPRFDLITVNNSGTKACTAGTAAANPVFPAIPASSVVLAAVYVPAADTTIATNQITDKRVTVSPHGAILATKLSDTTVTNTTTETLVFTGTVPGGLLAAGDVLRSHLAGNLLSNSGSASVFHFRIQFGTTLLTSSGQSLGNSTSRSRWSATSEMVAVSTTAQRFGIAIPVAQSAVTSPFAPHTFVFSGTGATAEDTSTDKAFEWRVKMDTANALVEMVAHTGYLQIFKASG